MSVVKTGSIVLALVLSLVGPALAAAPRLPWTTFSAMSRDAVMSGPTHCGIGVLTNNGEVAYLLFVNDSATRIVVWYDPNPGDPTAPPTHMASATVSPGSDVIPPLQWRPFVVGTDENPCLALNAWNMNDGVRPAVTR